MIKTQDALFIGGEHGVLVVGNEDDFIKPKRYEGAPVIGLSEKAPIKFGDRPTKKMARKTCKRCYGRGWIGFNRITGQHEPCKCVRVFEIEQETPEYEIIHLTSAVDATTKNAEGSIYDGY